MVICFNFLSGKSRYHAVESGVTSLIPAVGNSWFKTRIFPSLLLTAIIDGRFFIVLCGAVGVARTRMMAWLLLRVVCQRYCRVIRSSPGAFEWFSE